MTQVFQGFWKSENFQNMQYTILYTRLLILLKIRSYALYIIAED